MTAVALALFIGLLAIAIAILRLAFAVLHVAFHLNATRLQMIQIADVAIKWYGVAHKLIPEPPPPTEAQVEYEVKSARLCWRPAEQPEDPRGGTCQ